MNYDVVDRVNKEILIPDINKEVFIPDLKKKNFIAAARIISTGLKVDIPGPEQ